MAKNVLTNKRVFKAELNFMLERLRSAIAYEGKNKCSIYLAGVHKETYAALSAMGIEWSVKRWCTFLNAPKKGSKAWKALFEGSNVLDEAKTFHESKVAAAKAEKKSATVKKAAAKAEKKPTEKKAATKKVSPKAEKKATAKKAEKPAPKKAAAKAEKKATAKKAAAKKVAPKAETTEEKKA